MYEYLCRVQLPEGQFIEIPIRAQSYGLALRQVEALYGPGSMLGVISEQKLN